MNAVRIALKVALFSIFLQSAFAGGSIPNELTPDQLNQVKKGELVFVTKEMGTAFPMTTSYLLIDSTPDQAAAVMLDGKYHKDFFPDLLKSDIVKWLDQTTYQIAMTVDLPWPVANEDLIVQDHVSKYSVDGEMAFRIDWNLVKADSTLKSDGSARFEKMGANTVLAYNAYVIPGSALAKFGKGTFLEKAKITVQALGNRVKELRVNAAQFLEQEVQFLHKTLGMN